MADFYDDDDSHVAKTSAIKSFVIVEESGIAKGIRRIIAYTGEEAAEVEARASAAEARYESILILNGKEREKGLKVFDTVRCFQREESRTRNSLFS